MTNQAFSEISSLDLDNIVGGTPGTQGAHQAPSPEVIRQIQQQAQQYCPNTAARYANINPNTVTRAQAQQMGNECVAEISPFLRGVARGRINGAINQAFGPAPSGH